MRFAKSMLALAACLLFGVQMRADVKVISQGPVEEHMCIFLFRVTPGTLLCA
jgi:hypothetical protein